MSLRPTMMNDAMDESTRTAMRAAPWRARDSYWRGQCAYSSTEAKFPPAAARGRITHDGFHSLVQQQCEAGLGDGKPL